MRWSAMAVVVLLGACGKGGGGGELGSGLLLPLAVGDQWTYQVTDGRTMAVSQKVTAVASFEAMDGPKAGISAFVLTSDVGQTRSMTWIEKRDDVALRHREDTLFGGVLTEKKWIDPASLRGPEEIPSVGQTFPDVYTEQSYSSSGTLLLTKSSAYQWKVDSANESVTVPAGTFVTVRMTRQSQSNKDRVVWWAPGIGKIKELDNNGVLEELQSFNVAGAPAP